MPTADSEMEGEIDPFDTREVLRWMARQPKGRAAVDWEPLRRWLARLRLPENDIHASFFSAMAAIAQAVRTGEFDQKDEEGRAKLGDYAIEAADYLYEHVRKVEDGSHKG